jgi:hypothetical protein
MSEDILNPLGASRISPRAAVDAERSTLTRNGYAERNEARLFALSIVRNDKYQKTLVQRAETGGLHPSIETKLWEYAWGKPTERVELSISEDMSSLPTGKLVERAKHIALRLAAIESEEASQLEEDKRKLVQAKLQEETDEARASTEKIHAFRHPSSER